MKKVRIFSLGCLIGLILIALFAALAGGSNGLHVYIDDDAVLAFGEFSTKRAYSSQQVVDILNDNSDAIGLNNNQLVLADLPDNQADFNQQNLQDADKNELVLNKIIPTIDGDVYVFDQYYKGIRVFGRQIKATLSDDLLSSVNSNFLSQLDVDVSPTICYQHALMAANAYLNDDIVAYCDDCSFNTHSRNDAEDDQPSCFFDNSSLQIYSIEINPTLVYAFEAQEGTVFVNAHSGSVEDFLPSRRNDSPVTITQEDYFGNEVSITADLTQSSGNSIYTLSDKYRNITIYDAKNSSTSIYGASVFTASAPSFSTLAVTAMSNISRVYDFYTDAENIGVSVFGVDNSNDGVYDNALANNEIQVRMYINFNVDNAFYGGGATSKSPYFVFGNGSKSIDPYAYSIEVVGHEYQHSVNDYLSGLIYSNASGALDEALADLFAILISDDEMDNLDFWTMAEDITPLGNGIRSIAEPSNGYRSSVSGQYPFCSNSNHTYHNNCDNGGVHYNSTIISHAFYRMYEYATQNNITAFNKQNMGRALYTTASKLTSNSNWTQFRSVFEYSTGRIGLSEADALALKECALYGFAVVGITANSSSNLISFKLTEGFEGTAPNAIAGVAGTRFSMPQTNVARDGYVMIGWAENPNEKNGSLLYYEGKTYDIPPQNMVLYPVAVPIWGNTVLSVWQGEGTQSCPYLIANSDDLATLAFYVNAYGLIECEQDLQGSYFCLTDDIDLLMEEWIPIGVDKNKLTIYFEGNHHTISNMRLSGSYDYQGIFGYISGSIKNITLDFADVKVDAVATGGIVGRMSGKISGCVNNGALISSGTYLGGIVGLAEDCIVENCLNNGDIKGNKGTAGGIAGCLNLSTRLANCINQAQVLGSMSGGIAGTIKEGIAKKSAGIYNCINAGDVGYGDASPTFSGGIAGAIYLQSEYTIAGCKSSSELPSKGVAGTLVGILSSDSLFNSQKNHVLGGGFIGSAGEFSTGIFAVSGFDFADIDFYKSVDSWTTINGASLYDFNVFWHIEQGKILPAKYQLWSKNAAVSFAGGNGTLSNPYLISSAEQLALLLTQGEGEYHYLQTADIDMGGKLWTGARLEGSYDGGEYIIFNLSMHSEFDAALFVEAKNSVVKNVRLVDCAIGSLNDGAGIAVDLDGGEIINCKVSGVVSALNYGAGVVARLNGRVILCLNEAVVAAEYASGVASAVLTALNGYRSDETSRVGILSAIEKSVNSGLVSGLNAAGIVAVAFDSVEIVDSINVGSISGANRAVGILALVGFELGKIDISGCKQSGSLQAQKTADVLGGVEGLVHTQAVVVNITKTHYIATAYYDSEIEAQITVNDCKLVDESSLKESLNSFNYYTDAQYFMLTESVIDCARLYIFVNTHSLLFTVVFLGADGAVVDIQQVERGDDAVLPEVEHKPMDEMYFYTLRWDGEYKNIQRDGIVVECYDAQLRQYEVSFVADRGGNLPSIFAAFMTAVEPSDAPSTWFFSFDGWYTDQQLSVQFDGIVTADITLYAAYSLSALAWIVIFGCAAVVLALIALVVIIVLRAKRRKKA